MTNREAAMRNILRVSRQLGSLRERAVFLGGSVTGLLLTDPAAPDVRQTADVDVVVPTSSYLETSALDEELRSLGFRHCVEPGAPACRWLADDCVVDVMPVGPGANAYDDRWSVAAIEHADRLEMQDGTWIRYVSAPYFVAIKLEAYGDRGAGDFLGSRDIEDIIQVVDGRPELEAEMTVSASELRTYVSAEFGALLDSPGFLESLSAHLLPDAASQARERVILDRMRRIRQTTG